MEKIDYDCFSTFVNVSKAISSTLELPSVLDLILKESVKSLELKAGVISLLNRENNQLELAAHLNLSQEFINKGPVDASKSISDVFTLKRAVAISDIKTNKDLQYPEACEKEGIKSILSVPVIFKDDFIGELRLYGGQPREFTYKEVEFITALAEQGGIAIENALYMEKVKNEHKDEMENLWDWFRAMTGQRGGLDG